MTTALAAASTTTAPAPPTSEDFPPPGVRLRKFTVAEYHLMAKAGVFVDGDPFELVNGWITRKMTRNPPHDGAIQLLDARIRSAPLAGWVVRIQSAMTTPDSEPEPDLAVVRGNVRTYLTRHPFPPDVGLLVEVADSSLDFDRTDKASLYARAGIAVYWIVNLVDSQVEVFTNSGGPAPTYPPPQIFHPGDFVPLILDGQQVAAIPVQDLLP